jgi:integrase
MRWWVEWWVCFAMPREVHNKLSAAFVRNCKQPGRHADGSGLYLVVKESGAKHWEWRGIVLGRRRAIGMGSVSLTSLAEAREKARDWRRIARTGVDPKSERDKAKRQSLNFADAARKVHAEQIVPNNRNGKHNAQWLSSLEHYAFDKMGRVPVHAVAQSDILRVLSPIWLNKPETARRVRQRLHKIFDWARVAGHRQDANPVDGIEQGLPKQKVQTKNHKAVPWQEVPEVMIRVAEEIEGMGALALRFTVLTAARSGEVRKATWAEMDLEQRVWTVPADRMKAGREHRVPLSDAAIAVLRAAQRLHTGKATALVFPSSHRGKPLSDMTLAAVLKRLEVDATVHGFRSSFRDWAEEMTSFPHEVKEAALAHRVKSKTERAYRRTDLFDKRRDMMDQWAVFALGQASEIVPLGA